MDSLFLSSVLQQILQARTPAFLSDRRTDGDSLGAICALAEIYRNETGRIPHLFLASPLPERYRTLPGAEWCVLGVEKSYQPDLLVVCDCSEEKYVDEWRSKFPSPPPVLNIDHHATNTLYGETNAVLTNAASTTEVIASLCSARGIVPSPVAATALLLGILFDTNLFQNGATRISSLQAAAQCVRWGATFSTVLRCLYSHRSQHALRLWGLALERLQEHSTLGTVSTFMHYREIERLAHGQEDVLEGLVDFLHVVTNMDTFLFFRETKQGGLKLSMRTRTKNVATLAASLGGGGHTKAAGCSLQNTELVVKRTKGQNLVKLQELR